MLGMTVHSSAPQVDIDGLREDASSFSTATEDIAVDPGRCLVSAS